MFIHGISGSVSELLPNDQTRFQCTFTLTVPLSEKTLIQSGTLVAAEKYGNRERRRHALGMLFAPFTSLPFDDSAARQYATIRHDLEVQGLVKGPNDLKIAAIALAHGLTLVSADKEFGRVPGLRLTDWSAG